ncbi:MAG: tryptophan--tRNA ligase [Oscillospiraceae bacterium]|jgi:tryptophanyl-tRNA synthetase|nr:tryptophan--tRNA ligase [Oscillospiraceae bacterium]
MDNTNEIQAKRKRVLSLIQPTSVPTLGNYLGAMRNWASLSAEYDCVYGVANLHALTVRRPATDLRKQTQELFAILLALDLNQGNNVVFVQSHVPSHCQLSWILSCYTQFGEMSRMTQFKEKAAQHSDNVNVGLFTYPTLMAADILIYQADLVPVGDDQKQHLEICRDIATRFNGVYPNTFTVPEPYIGKLGGRIMSLQDPTRKMSKSDPNPKGAISMLDDENTILKKCRGAVTDSETVVRYGEGKEGINNLMTIYACCTGESFEQIETAFAGQGYGAFKTAVAEVVIAALRPFREKYKAYMADPAGLQSIAAEGARAAARIADRTTEKAMKRVGLWRI